MESVTLTINGQTVQANSGDTILTAAAKSGIRIPSLCFLKDCNQSAACRICVVEVAGMRSLVPSCVTQVREGMEVQTESERVRKARKTTLDMLCKHHRMICDQCARYSDCEFHALCRRYGISEEDYNPYVMQANADDSATHLIRDTSKCVLCQRCVSACHAQGMDVISVLRRGWNTKISPPVPLADMNCAGCGQCVRACPTGALTIRDDTATVRDLIRQRKKTAIAVVMPPVGRTIGKLFCEETERDQSGKVVAMLKKLGFRRVYDGAACKAAFLNAEVEETKRRKASGGALPVISQVCPGVRNLVERQIPSLKGNLSGMKPLPEYCADLARTAFAEESGLPEEEILVVFINSCTAAKTLPLDGAIALTTYELAAMFRRACVSRFTARKVWEEQLEDASFDILSLPTQTAADSGQAITGLANVKEALAQMTQGSYPEPFLEGYACPGSCVNGGGAPRRDSSQI
ncbi:MAG: 2Fe-2S iron-sulfur cluster-binding protein [Clostridiales bacterium]|nr:2Fe-2S iron-sulfur cluster-binding protein [Clostridiales bacterium]